MIARRTPLKRSAAPRKKRPCLRRGQLSPVEKAAVRKEVYERAGGRCELVPDCARGVLPWDGDVFTRAHLVHLRCKRVHGWGMQNVAIGCNEHHRASHDGRLKLPKTYDELTTSSV